MTPFHRLLLASLPVVVPFCASAQTETRTTLPSVVITTDREPIPAEKVTGTVTVITRDEIERRQLRTVEEVLRSVPGVSVPRRARATGRGQLSRAQSPHLGPGRSRARHPHCSRHLHPDALLRSSRGGAAPVPPCS